MNEPTITLVGHLAAPPRLRTTAAGVCVADFRVAATPRRHDKGTGEWGDGETLWFTVTAWRALAEHCAASLGKGDKVVVTGRLTVRSWRGDDGVERSGLEVDAASVGLDLSRGRAAFVRTPPLSMTEPPPSGEPDEPQAYDEEPAGEPGLVAV
ncbi:MAG: ssb [Frankiales bacterium]|nr:ssb [Frankiales bacterium]